MFHCLQTFKLKLHAELVKLKERKKKAYFLVTELLQRDIQDATCQELYLLKS